MNGTRYNIRHVVAMCTKHPCLFISGLLLVLAAGCTWFSCRGDDLLLYPSQRPLFPHNSKVHEISDGSLDALSKFIDKSTLKFVFYYAPWCGQSKKAIPEFIRAANILHQEVTFIAINCWSGSCQKEYQLEYFPQLVAYHTTFPGVQYPETNDLRSLYMIRFLYDILRPFTYLGREKELQELQATNQEVVLSYIDNVNKKEYRRFFGAALEYVGRVSRPIFGLVTNFNIANKFGLKTNGEISFYRALDSTPKFHPKANNSIKNITTWISQHRKQIITELVPKPSNKDFLKTQLNEKPAVIIFLPVRRLKISTPLLKTYTKIARDYSNCTCANTTRHKLINLASHDHNKDVLPLPINPDDIQPSSTQPSKQEDPIKTSVYCGSLVIKDAKSNNICNICQRCISSCCHGDFMDIYHRVKRNIPYLVAPCRSFRLFYYPMVRASVCCHGDARTRKYSSYKENLKKKFKFTSDKILQQKIDNFIDSFYEKVIKVLDPLQKDYKDDGSNYEGTGLNATPQMNRSSFSPAVSTASTTNITAYGNGSLATPELSSDGCNRTGHVMHFHGASCHSNRSVNFFYMDSERFWSVAERLGVNASATKDKVCVIVVDVKNEAYYTMKEDHPVTNKTIVEFVMKFMNAKLQRSLRSADAPQSTCSESQSCVVEVTLNTLERVVMDTNKDVLLVYFAPWCGFCINLAPVLLTVARFFKDFKNVLIARIDADQNDLPWQHTVTSYPTIVLYPARRKDFSVRFPDASERTAEALILFILRHGTEAALQALNEKVEGNCDSEILKNKLAQLESSLRRAEEEKQFLETRFEGLVMEKSLLELKHLKLLKGMHEAQSIVETEKDLRVSMKSKLEHAEGSRRQSDIKNLVLALRNVQLESEVSKLKEELQESIKKLRKTAQDVERFTMFRQEIEEMNELVVKKLDIAENTVAHLRQRDRTLSSKLRRLQNTRNSLFTRLTRSNVGNIENKKLISELNLEKNKLTSLLREAEITITSLKTSLASSEKRLGDEEDRHNMAVQKHEEANNKLQEMKVNYEKLTVILSQIDIPKKQQLK